MLYWSFLPGVKTNIACSKFFLFSQYSTPYSINSWTFLLEIACLNVGVMINFWSYKKLRQFHNRTMCIVILLYALIAFILLTYHIKIKEKSSYSSADQHISSFIVIDPLQVTPTVENRFLYWLFSARYKFVLKPFLESIHVLFWFL